MMSPFSCPREPETIRSVWTGRWPEGCDDELRVHVEGCVVCREAVDLSSAFHEERKAALLEARVPASGIVWWRAQLRARREAAIKAERPVALAQGLALVTALAAAGVVSWTLLPSVRAFFRQLAANLPAPAGLFASLGSPASALSELSALGLLAQPGILIVLAATLALAPVAIYLAVAKD